ncbi:MDR family MFS transporter [Bacillus taeanensis]|uniref:MDR family MFS transporter n=1 Tax=Bacillus taeanensis TaxID=273032 RepID=UPI001FE81F5E|nr:MDR family MFS transporter [Bacillus taeanensis]
MTENSSSNFWLIILAIFFGNFMAILSTTTINVAFPIFMDVFHAEIHTVQWLMAGFLLATGVSAPIVGYLGDKWSYKYLYLFALAGFTLWSFLCVFAWNIESLIAFRILQGLFSGLIIPTTMTLIYQLIEKEKQAFALSLWSLSSMLAPAFGPTLGGVLIEYFGWKSLFILNLPIGIIAIVVVFFCIPYYKLSKLKGFDFIGFTTVILSSTLLLLVFSQGNQWGITSWKTLTLLSVGIVFLGVFIKRERSIKQPLLNLRVFQFSRFTYSLILNCIITASIYAGSLLIPVFMQNVQGASALETAIVLLPGSIVMAFLSPVVGKLYGKIGPFTLAISGVILLILSTWELSHLTPTSSHLYAAGWMTLRYVGIALAFMPITNAGMSAIPKENSGHASAVTNWIRQATGALSIGIFSAVLAARSILHQEELSNGGMTNNQLAEAHGMTQGINDVFFMATIICVIALPFTFLLKERKKAAPVIIGREVEQKAGN